VTSKKWTPPPCPTSSVWNTLPPTVHGRPDRIARKLRKRKVFCAPEVCWRGEGGVGGSDSDTNFKTQKNVHLWTSGLWQTPDPVHIASNRPLPSDPTFLMDGPQRGNVRDVYKTKPICVFGRFYARYDSDVRGRGWEGWAPPNGRFWTRVWGPKIHIMFGCLWWMTPKVKKTKFVNVNL